MAEIKKNKAKSEDRRSVNPVALQSYLKGIQYPATKQDVLDVAGDNGAPDEIVEAISEIADITYASPAEVTKEMGRTAHSRAR